MQVIARAHSTYLLAAHLYTEPVGKVRLLAHSLCAASGGCQFYWWRTARVFSTPSTRWQHCMVGVGLDCCAVQDITWSSPSSWRLVLIGLQWCNEGWKPTKKGHFGTILFGGVQAKSRMWPGSLCAMEEMLCTLCDVLTSQKNGREMGERIALMIFFKQKRTLLVVEQKSRELWKVWSFS